MKIGVISYGAGNIGSVVNMIKKAGGEADIITEPSCLNNAEKLIFPGVGSFDHAMNLLIKNNWIEALNEAVLNKQIPILGICLGMQLMCKKSEEGVLDGLGWIEAEVKKFPDPVEDEKVPHMGWNSVDVVAANPLIEPGKNRFYFVHSYQVVLQNEDNAVGKTTHINRFTCAFQKNHMFGAQFHPEKSHKFGMEIFRGFLAL